MIQSKHQRAQMSGGKQTGDNHRPPHGHITRYQCLIPFVPLPQHKQYQRRPGADEEPNDGGSFPFPFLAAVLHRKQEHKNARDEDEVAREVEGLDAALHAAAAALEGAEEGRDNEDSPRVNGDVDPADREM